MKKDMTIDEILQDQGFDDVEKNAFTEFLQVLRDNQEHQENDADKYLLTKVKEVAEYEIQKNRI